MNSARSDASTSTDDVKGRPLCLFYFSAPFGVLSPEPPVAWPAPPHVARTFVDMQPVSPWCWAGEPRARRSAATGSGMELGAAAVHARPLRVLSVRRDLPPPDLWLEPRRPPPCPRMLPPLRLPSARDLCDLSSDDVWPRKCLHPEKFSLPPIEMPAPAPRAPSARASSGTTSGAAGRTPRVRRLGVDKQRRRRRAAARAADVRRALATLLRRPVTAVGGHAGRRRRAVMARRPHSVWVQRARRTQLEPRAELTERPPPGAAPHSPSGIYGRGPTTLTTTTIAGPYHPIPALPSRGWWRGEPARRLARALRTLRAAWPEPKHASSCEFLSQCVEAGAAPRTRAMHAPAEPAPRAHASPGLLRRRYSVPETIMRKYRLATQGSDSEESVTAAHASTASACPSPAREPSESPQRFLRRDRELMRKSALLRRMWARPCPAAACCSCEHEARATRSLDGSRSELTSRRSPARCEPKRQRLHAAPAPALSTCPRCDDVSCADTAEVYTDTESRAPASPPPSDQLLESVTNEFIDTSRTPPPMSRFYDESETISSTLSTTKETEGSTDEPPQNTSSSNDRIDGHIGECSADDGGTGEREDLSYERALTVEATPSAPLYELLEIVVSESADSCEVRAPTARGTPPTARGTPPTTALSLTNTHDIDIDEYVSNILVSSLNSLTDQLECMSATIGGDRRISIVEKEIKVRLQNTGVNTIVHLSPTSNNQIIFGNEELCNEVHDECNNPLSFREERERSAESNNNLSSSADTTAPHAQPPDGVHRAVLQQIQQLFRDELRGLEPAAAPAVTLGDVSNVDAYMEAAGEAGACAELQITTSLDCAPIAGVGAGNYFRDGDDAVAVPRFSAYPHTESMEVNTSSSSDADAPCSDCTSLVDSLDDPNSPRGMQLRRRVDLARSAVDVLELLPESARDASAESRGEAFFVRIQDDDRNRDQDHENVKVAEYMPEKIKQRLYRRHRKRELRVECARRSKVKQLKRELERRRLEEAAQARRELERDCVAIINALIDDVVAKIAQDEYKSMRARRRARSGKLPASRSEESLKRRDAGRERVAPATRVVSRRALEDGDRLSEGHHIRGKLLARPSLADPARPPRRIYQKSEIHEGEKCIEILEILEYVNESRSSPETTNSDENHNQSSKSRKSRIPIPVTERSQRWSGGEGRMRLTGGDGRCTSPPGASLAGLLLRALAEPALVEAAPAPALVPEPRERSNSLRFKRVFDIIPEERSSLSLDSSAEDAELARRASALEVCVPPATPAPRAPPAESPRRVASTRSAGTSPPLLEERARPLRSQTTMTSPCCRSAATSPLRSALRPPPHPAPPRPAPPRPAPPRPAREGRGSMNGVSERGTADPSPRTRRPSPSSSSDSGDSGGSLLCSLAPRWLSAQARQRRRARRPPRPTPAPPPPSGPPAPTQTGANPGGGAPGGWSVTVAGSCRAALPADVEMRLRFPQDASPAPASTAPAPASARCAGCGCTQCVACGRSARAALPPPEPAPAQDSRLTLTVKKEAQDSSIMASKSVRKGEQLPELETYRSSRTKLKSSVKTRRGYSLHCWLPAGRAAPSDLSVLGCAIIPELKPRVPTMSERDLTRVYTPRHYLRS